MLGIAALAVAVFVAAFAISTYQAWWTIALVVFAIIVLGVERTSLRGAVAARTAGGLIGSIVLGAAGAWMLLLAVIGRARPCDTCFDNGVLLLPGIATVAVAIVVGAVSLRSAVRGFRSTPR